MQFIVGGDWCDFSLRLRIPNGNTAKAGRQMVWIYVQPNVEQRPTDKKIFDKGTDLALTGVAQRGASRKLASSVSSSTLIYKT